MLYSEQDAFKMFLNREAVPNIAKVLGVGEDVVQEIINKGKASGLTSLSNVKGSISATVRTRAFARSNSAIRISVPEMGPIEVRNNSDKPIYVKAYQSKISGRFFVDLYDKQIAADVETVNPSDYLQPDIKETI